MKLYFIRHQIAGIVVDSPFAEPPTPEQCAKVLARVAEVHSDTHKKTGPCWAKVVCVEDGVTTTIGGCNGESAEDIDAKASGHCPIRAAGLKRSPEAGPPAAGAATGSGARGGSGMPDVIGAGTGHVRNP